MGESRTADEPHKYALPGRLGDVTEVDFLVDTAGSCKCLVQSVGIVRGHDEETTLLRCISVDGVKKTTQGDEAAPLAVGLSPGARSVFRWHQRCGKVHIGCLFLLLRRDLATDTGGVDVFDDYDTLLRQAQEQIMQFTVRDVA